MEKKIFPTAKREGVEIKGNFSEEKGEMLNQEKGVFPVKGGKYRFRPEN